MWKEKGPDSKKKFPKNCNGKKQKNRTWNVGHSITSRSTLKDICIHDEQLYMKQKLYGLGHLNECEMVKLHKKGLLKGVWSCKLDLCEYLVLGK